MFSLCIFEVELLGYLMEGNVKILLIVIISCIWNWYVTNTLVPSLSMKFNSLINMWKAVYGYIQICYTSAENKINNWNNVFLLTTSYKECYLGGSNCNNYKKTGFKCNV